MYFDHAPCSAWETPGPSCDGWSTFRAKYGAGDAGKAERQGFRASRGDPSPGLQPSRSGAVACPPPTARRYGPRGCRRRSRQRVGWESHGEQLQPTGRVSDGTPEALPERGERCDCGSFGAPWWTTFEPSPRTEVAARRTVACTSGPTSPARHPCVNLVLFPWPTRHSAGVSGNDLHALGFDGRQQTSKLTPERS